MHWHADYQVWVCGERLNLIDPKFPSNKIGTNLLHEHDDQRVHIEGTLHKVSDVSLHNYFEVIGGKLTSDMLAYQTNEQLYEYKNGDLCDSQPAMLKVYVNGQRVEDYENYIFYPDSYVPPGDCILVVFDNSTDSTTDRLCESWEVNGWNYENFKRPEVTIGDRSWN